MIQHNTIISKDILLHVYGFLDKTIDKETIFNLAAINKQTHRIIHSKIKEDYKYIITEDNCEHFDGIWDHIYIKSSKKIIYVDDDNNNNEYKYQKNCDIDSEFLCLLLTEHFVSIPNIVEYGENLYLDKLKKYCRLSSYGVHGYDLFTIFNNIKRVYNELDILHFDICEWYEIGCEINIEYIAQLFNLKEFIFKRGTCYELNKICENIISLTIDEHIFHWKDIIFFPNLEYLNGTKILDWNIDYLPYCFPHIWNSDAIFYKLNEMHLNLLAHMSTKMLANNFPNLKILSFSFYDNNQFIEGINEIINLHDDMIILFQKLINIGDYIASHEIISANIDQFINIFKIAFACALYHFVPNVINKLLYITICDCNILIHNIKSIYDVDYKYYFDLVDINELLKHPIYYITQCTYLIAKIQFSKKKMKLATQLLFYK